MHNYSSYNEAANAARALARETHQTVKVTRDQNGWIVNSNQKNTDSFNTDDVEAIFSRKRGDYDTDYDTDPPF